MGVPFGVDRNIAVEVFLDVTVDVVLNKAWFVGMNTR